VKHWKKYFWHAETKITQEYLFLYKTKQILHKKISQKRCKSLYILIKGTTQQEDITILNIYIYIYTYIYIYNEHPYTQLHKTNTSELKGTRHSIREGLQHPTLFNMQNIRQKLTRIS
jgi:hypothetical protein